MSRRLLGVLLAVGVAALALPAPPALAGVWLAGDLHVHTTYSHDSYGGPGDDNTGPQNAYTLGHSVASQFAVARSRGLDYLAITDHNDIRSQSDPGFATQGVIGVPAYENSLRGHAQMLGARRLYPNGDRSAAAVDRLAAALRADGGVFQVNHPIDPAWEYGYAVVPDTVEAWNIPWYYQPPFPAASDNDRALRYWEGWLDRGRRIGVTGGSDNHYVSTTAVQGAGQPTTWVYARDRSVPAILDGLRAGHTFVSHEPPAYGGPRLFLEGDANRDGTYEAMAGDAVPPGSALRVRVVGAQGAYLRVVGDRGAQAFAPVPVTSGDFEQRFRLAESATWVRAEVYGEDERDQRALGCSAVFGADATRLSTYCSNRVLMLALSSAIYLRRPSAPAARPEPRRAGPGRARLHAPRECMGPRSRIWVTGRAISRVVFRLDGRAPRTVRRADRHGRFVLPLYPRRLRRGAHRLAAQAFFVRASASAPRRMRTTLRVCRTTARARFTG